MFYMIIATLAGMTIVISRSMNAHLAKEIGTFQSTFFNFLTGLLLSTIFVFVSKDYIQLSTNVVRTVPFYAYLGGALGLVVVVLSNYTTHKISAFYLTLFVFIGQLFTGIVIDYFSLHIFSIGKLMGTLLVCIGLSYNLYIDTKMQNKEAVLK